MSFESRVSAALQELAQQFNLRKPDHAIRTLNAGTVIWDLNGSPAGENTFFERTWDTGTSTDATRVAIAGNGITFAANQAGRHAELYAQLTADAAINNRLTGVVRIMRGTTEIVLGGNYGVRSAANDEGTFWAGPFPYVVQGGETLTVQCRFSQDGNSTAANISLGTGSYFYAKLEGGR